MEHSTTTNSSEPENVAGRPKCEGEKADYPISQITGLNLLKSVLRNNISRACLVILVELSYRWVAEHRSSTCYALCDGDHQKVMFTYQCLIKLRSGGYIEVVAVGNSNSKSYAPTPSGLALLQGYAGLA